MEHIQGSTKDIWDKLKVLTGLIASVLIPVVIAWIGFLSSEAVKSQDISIKYTQLAVGILQSKESLDSPGLREWAVKVIDKHSSVPLGDEAYDQLFNKGLPDTIASVDDIISLADQLGISDIATLKDMVKSLETAASLKGNEDFSGMSKLRESLNIQEEE